MTSPTKPGRSDYAYTAGLIDGEGSIILRTHRERYYPRVQVASTSLELVTYLHETYGGCLSSSLRPPRKREYTWALNGRVAVSFLHQVLPFLREDRKCARAEFLISEFPWSHVPDLRERFYDV